VSRYLIFLLLGAVLTTGGCSTSGWLQRLESALPGAAAHRAALQALNSAVEQALAPQIASQVVTIDRSNDTIIRVRLDGRWCFGLDAASLATPAANALGRLAKTLAAHEAAVKVTGHTDSIGSVAENLDLSRLRAAAVAQVLRAQGLGADRVQTEAKGSAEPLATNATEAGRQLNNRIELDIGLDDR